jgi:hypothetical protein
MKLYTYVSLQAILDGMHGVQTKNVHRVINALENIKESLEDIMKSMKLLHSKNINIISKCYVVFNSLPSTSLQVLWIIQKSFWVVIYPPPPNVRRRVNPVMSCHIISLTHYLLPFEIPLFQDFRSTPGKQQTNADTRIDTRW